MKKNLISLIHSKTNMWFLRYPKFVSQRIQQKVLCSNFLVILVTFPIILLLAQISASQSKPEWGGYLQTRFSSDFSTCTGFSIRRAKLWVDGPAPAFQNFYFHVQGIFKYQTGGTFMLQDAYGQYRTPFCFLRVGQFVPDFSLERQQPDALIPLIERAAAVNVLIPTGDTYARDIGVELVLEPKGSGFHSSFGIYNGNGGNTKSNDDRHFLYTNRTIYRLRFSNKLSWVNGFSVAYRNKKDLPLPSILGSGATFSGKDFRWGIESHLRSDKWEIQAEYIRADLDNRVSYGYYAFCSYDFDKFNEIILSTEKLHVLNKSYRDAPWYIVGYSHFFNAEKLKLMADLRAQYLSSRTNFAGTFQIQIFFN